MKIRFCVLALLILTLAPLACQSVAVKPSASADPAQHGWMQIPFHYAVQKPYDLKLSDRYSSDTATNTHRLWVYGTDKSHQPPPNTTTARTEMRFQDQEPGEYMFDADYKITSGSYACIMQVFAGRGPMGMMIVQRNGDVTYGGTRIIMHGAYDHWFNMKVINQNREDGVVKVYIDNQLAGTFNNQGVKPYYFKAGVYSRHGSDRSEVLLRDIKYWVNPKSVTTATLAALKTGLPLTGTRKGTSADFSPNR